MGNARLNYGRDKKGVLFTEDGNDYYPFGLNFINPVGFGAGQFFNPSATYKNYKYNGKELQETGMYDYGARMYMPDAVIWGQYDPLAEITCQPYAYAFNNPIFFNDPTGMIGEGPGKGDIGPDKPGGVNNPHQIQEVVITKERPITNKSAGVSLPSNCVACFASGNFNINLPKPQISARPFDPYANCGWCHDGPIKYIGGAGDPFGIWEALGMALASEDSNVKYMAVPLLILKGQEDDALKILAAEKGDVHSY